MFLIGQREYPQRGRMANVDRNKAQRANIQSLRSSRNWLLGKACDNSFGLFHLMRATKVYLFVNFSVIEYLLFELCFGQHGPYDHAVDTLFVLLRT
jgi:hypothetical protein